MHTNNIRFYITEACNAKCPNCFNKENRNETYMDVKRFEKLCQYFSRNGGSQIKIMGGEPTIHPNFEEIMRIAQLNFPVVSLFTNALSPNLLKFKPREEDIITYNFKFRRRLNKENMFLDLPGIRNLEIQVTPSVIKEKLFEEILRVTSFDKSKIIPCFTLDCTTNIYEDREQIIPIYEYLISNCSKEGLKFGQDHLIPLCFLSGSKIPMPKSGTNCMLDCAGLVDSNYNVRFCNQYPDVLTNMFEGGDIIPVSIFVAKLKDKYDDLLSQISKKGCGSCVMFGRYCNGGCFLGKSVIPSILPKF